MRIVLIGGLKNGKLIAEYLNNHKKTQLQKVYVLKDDLAQKVSDYMFFDDVIPSDKLTKVEKINDHAEEIKALKPDLIFVVGWSQLISNEIINSARIGVIGFHPTKLPKDRGRSVLAWQIAEGYEKGCVSMFWIDSGIDSGEIIGQQEFDINYNDTIKDVLDKVYNICFDLTRTYYPLIVNGNVISIKQDENYATYRRKRGKEDGIINWNKNSREVYNLVRAITHPYPGASTFYKGKEIIVLEVEEQNICSEYRILKPGTILEVKLGKGTVIKCKDKAVLIKKIKIENEIILEHEMQTVLKLGDVLG